MFVLLIQLERNIGVTLNKVETYSYINKNHTESTLNYLM